MIPEALFAYQEEKCDSGSLPDSMKTEGRPVYSYRLHPLHYIHTWGIPSKSTQLASSMPHRAKLSVQTNAPDWQAA